MNEFLQHRNLVFLKVSVLLVNRICTNNLDYEQILLYLDKKFLNTPLSEQYIPETEQIILYLKNQS